jgi:hypothetical protein
MRVRQAAEGAAELLELLLGVDRRGGRRLRGDQAPVVSGAEALAGVEGDLLGAARAPELVDAGVLGDLVDPGLERDRPVGLAHAAQRGDEDLLRDVLRAAVVLDHAEHVGGDAALIPAVELLEGAVVAAPHGRDEAGVEVALGRLGGHDDRYIHDHRSPAHSSILRACRVEGPARCAPA